MQYHVKLMDKKGFVSEVQLEGTELPREYKMRQYRNIDLDTCDIPSAEPLWDDVVFYLELGIYAHRKHIAYYMER